MSSSPKLVPGKRRPRRKKPAQPAPVERMYRASEVAEMLAISESEVRRLADHGELLSLRIGRKGKRQMLVFPASYIKQYVDKLMSQAESPRWARGHA